MRPILKPEVVVAAYGAYAAITLGVALLDRTGAARLTPPEQSPATPTCTGRRPG